MKLEMTKANGIVAGLLALSLQGFALGANLSTTDFTGFTTGVSVNGQGGWGSSGAWDETVVSDGGNIVWRVSNAITSGSFGDMPFAPRPGGLPTDTVTDPDNSMPGFFAGETQTGAAANYFNAEFKFRSATGAAQPGLRITLSADNGQGGRQGFIALRDNGTTGIDVDTFDVDSAGNFIGPVTLATALSYTAYHTLRIEVFFKDGADNDDVNYYVNGVLVHSDNSWEQFYTAFQPALHPLGVPVQTLIFRLSGTAAPTVAGGGYYIDDVVIDAESSLELALRAPTVLGPAEPVRVYVDLSSGRGDITSVGSRLSYDPAAMSFVSLVKGSGAPASWSFAYASTATAGEVDFVLTDQTPAAARIAGPVTALEVVCVTFQRTGINCTAAAFGFNPAAPVGAAAVAAFPTNHYTHYINNVSDTVQIEAASTSGLSGPAVDDHGFIRGNVNNRSAHALDIGDVVDLASFLFAGFAPAFSCAAAFDSNNSGTADITDLVTSVQGIFNSAQVKIAPPSFANPGPGIPGVVVPDGGTIPSLLGCADGETCP